LATPAAALPHWKLSTNAIGFRYMAKGRKRDWPTKICATCGRGFTWRKKWARAWVSVRYWTGAAGNEQD